MFTRLGTILQSLRLRHGLDGLASADPIHIGTTPVAQIEQQSMNRAYSPALPAAEWTEDITRHNAQIAADYDAELARRTALLERGEYVPRFGSPENDLAFEMRTVNVTGQAVLQPSLTPAAHREARTVAGLREEVAAIERSQPRTVPARPSRQEVLDACGGDPVRAAQLQARVDDLFGGEG